MPVMKQDLLASGTSTRRVDAEGRLHIEVNNLTKACVNKYLGAEIPDAAALGLKPDQLYALLRDPAELKKAMPTINNIQLLIVHIGVTAEDPKKAHVVGTTGSEAKWVPPYIKNSLAVWDAKAIAGIETKDQCQLSSSYRYRADMTPGTYEGVPYDGVMRDIAFNHVALVEEGRAGPDVLVGDSANNPRGFTMTVKRKVALTAVADEAQKAADNLRTMMANDAALKPAVAKLDKIAMDAKKAADKAKDDEEMSEDADLDDETDEEKKARLAKEAKDKKAKDMKGAKDKKAKDADPDGEQDDKIDDLKEEIADLKEQLADAADDKKAKDKKAMDAAINTAVSAATKRMQEATAAADVVRPTVGNLKMAFDSADAVYKAALDIMKVDVKGVDPSAYATVFKYASKPSAAGPAPHFANDAARTDGPSLFLADRIKARG